MRQVRSHRRLGAWVALFALALQLALSFGHIHLDAIGLGSAPAQAATLAQGGGDDGAPPGGPSGGRHHDGHDFCAICATMSLAASTVLPVLASLVLPVDHAQDWLAEAQTAQIPFDPHLIFQARAPPALS